MSAPVDVLAVLRQTAIGLHGVADECTNSEFAIVMNQRAQAMDAASPVVAELIEAGHRADGDKRPERPERGPGYSDAEWEVFLRGWNAHAEAVYSSGLRAALARVGGAS